MTNFRWLKLSESNPVHNDFTYKHNLTFIRLLENCATEFRGRIKFVSELCVYTSLPLGEVGIKFSKLIMGKRKHIEQIYFEEGLNKLLSDTNSISWPDSCINCRWKRIEVILMQYL